VAHTFELTDMLLNMPKNGVPEGWSEKVREGTQRQIEDFLADELRGVPVRHVLLEGDVATSIAQFAHAEKADLIVMPTHGYGRFRRFILGSVTAKLLHDADCPIFTTAHLEQHAPQEPIFFRNILCAIDFDAAGERALRWAAALASDYHARVTVVHALPEFHFSEMGYYDQELPRLLKDGAMQQMSGLQKSAGVTAQVVLETGSVSNVVRAAASVQSADLIVIGRHENAGMLGRLRANAYAIVRESPCPVVSV
jgi:nucleotide-binding universal stress UspA family protein